MGSKYTVPVLKKTFKVIEEIAKHPDGLSFIDIVNELNEPKSTVFRILHTLEEYNWIEKRGDAYILGFMFIHYGLTTLSRKSLRSVARPYLQKLTQTLQETSHITVLSGEKSMMLDVTESPHHIKLPSQVGTLLPLYCTSHGKVFLAFSFKAELHEVLKEQDMVQRTPNTITSLSEMHKEIERIRRRGYSVDDLEYYEDVRCVAAPVWGPDGICIAAVGITATAVSFPREKIEQYAELVIETANSVSREMGNSM